MSRLMIPLLLVALATLSADGIGDETALLQTADGEPRQAKFTGIDEEFRFHFVDDEKESQVAAANLIAWGVATDTHRGTQVLLVDGSLLVADEVRLKGDRLEVDSSLFGVPRDGQFSGTIAFPLDAVRAVIFRVPIPALQRDRLLLSLESAVGDADRLLLVNGDVLEGTVEKLQRVKLADDGIGPLAVTLATRSGPIELRPKPGDALLEKVTALVFNPALARAHKPADLRVLMTFADGSRLWVNKLTHREDQPVFHTSCGEAIPAHPDEEIWPQVESLRTFGGRATYITELPSQRYQHRPLLNAAVSLGENRNTKGGRLRTAGQVAFSGLGMPGQSRVMYLLGPTGKKFKRLEGELAIDESAGSGGSVEFAVATVVKDKPKLLYPKPDQRATIRGGQPPRTMSVDVTGVTNVILVVNPADRGSVLDRANWMNLRLVE